VNPDDSGTAEPTGSADADPAEPDPSHADAYVPGQPDDKDWTWVLRERCPECGFAGTDVDARDVAGTIHDLVPRWRAALNRLDARERPASTVWSALEYGAHVRDVHRVFVQRLDLMLTQDDPGRVADELADAAAALAERFAAVGPEQWGRTGRRSNGSEFTVTTLAQYFLHDVVHHLHDVHA
jgi:hypothetical protein